MIRRTLALSAALASAAPAQRPPVDPLAQGFRQPPMSARPRAWWHWLNGNVTQEGIDKDLAWMADVGLGGVQAFDASLGTPQVVAHRLPYMSAEWKAAFAHAAATADRLGLELAIASSPGWSETGGPWVAPADAMKKLVWSRTDVTGGTPVSLRLPAPSGVTGAYGTAAFNDPIAAFGESAAPPRAASGDAALFAYPIDDAAAVTPHASDQRGNPLDGAILGDMREHTAVAVPRGTTDHPAAIMLAFDRPQQVRSITIFVPGAVPPFGEPEFRPGLEAETASGWTRIATVPLGTVPTTVAFPPTTATRFRLTFAANVVTTSPLLAPPAPGAVVGGIFPAGAAPTTIAVGTLRLSGEALVNRFEAKAGFQTVPDFYALASDAPDLAGIRPERVIDLTSRMRPDGTLDWTPPAGRWRIVRLGWSLLGTTNHPASAEATGLEVDKYDGAAVRRYLAAYLDTYRGAMGGGDGKGIDALLTDSIEAGDANWTPRMLEQFQRLRGYDPRPWLPALTGAVVGSRARSDAFLYDWRRTLADLIASEHYGTIATIAHERGLKLYGEALENGRPQLGDDIAMRAHTDVPMAAMWAFPADGAPRPTLMGDILGAASVAHVYGRNLVAAESFTSAFSPWAFAPADLRRVADLEFALGVNRPVIHTSPNSPMDDKEPGLSLAIFGQYFNRHESWAGMARPWVDYLARTGFLLQQGRHVADIAYFIGEEAPLTALYAQAPLADVPQGRGFDFVNADVLANELRVEDHDLVARGGARYRALYLGGSSRRMTLPTLRHIAALAGAGATIVGDAPIDTPSLADDRAAFARLVRRLWPGGGEVRIGRGRVIPGRDADAALTTLGVPRDLDAGGREPGTLLFQHRTLPGADIYFVDNRARTPRAGEVRLRVTGRAAEIWRADTGAMAPASYRVEHGQTAVSLDMRAEESLFVVFRHPAHGDGARIADTTERTVRTVDGPWQVAFQPGRGAPAGVTLPALAPLDRQGVPGIRYFSGVATYTTHFDLPHTEIGGDRLLLDLGQVGDVADVRVNGVPIGAAWHAPYRMELGSAAHAGTNLLEVRVANLWVNRLIGDAQPGATKITFTVAPTYRPDAPLRPSGLIGPVGIVAVHQEK